jgi:hypothetical protein
MEVDVQSQDVVVHSPALRRMRYGRTTSRLRPNDAAYSIRAPRVEREHPHPRQTIRPEPEDGCEVAA